MTAPTKDAVAVDYMLNRIREDGRLAYLLVHTQAWRLMVEAAAERSGAPVDEFIRQHLDGVQTTRVVVAEKV